MQRIGLGYDSHRFVAGRPLVLGGVRIAHERGLAGHSDADAVLHAITDAVLGAVGAGDIGELFADSDPQWRDADSSRFLHKAVSIAKQNGYVIGNCDVTVIAEVPKLSPHKQAMRQNIAALLGVDRQAVSVKAKTNEGMGFIGRGEGIACLAVVRLDSQAQGRPPRA